MKNLLYFLPFIFIENYMFSQSVILPPLNRYKYESIVVDSGCIRVLYALNAVDITDAKTYDDLQRLEIGLNISKFYSYFYYYRDSLVRDFIKKNPKAQGFSNQSGPFGKKGNAWSLIIWSDFFKDFSKNEFTEYANMPHGAIPPYQYTEKIPIQEWKVHEDTLTVCGFLCQKATCRFRGNDFTAWYAPNVPISNGPWKFGGLSGLILKVYDKNKHYDFECIKIEYHTEKFPIFLFDEKRYIRTERLALRQLEKDIHENFKAIGGWINTDGTIPKFEPNPYHPLELE